MGKGNYQDDETLIGPGKKVPCWSRAGRASRENRIQSGKESMFPPSISTSRCGYMDEARTVTSPGGIDGRSIQLQLSSHLRSLHHDY